ncbi:hypothetical protein OC844_006414 [Tilletia horrida]|nr:hypothetical protein OC844_006414 [Tilletia horrida]
MPPDPLASLFTPTPPSSPLFGLTPPDFEDNGGYPSDQAAEYDSTPIDSLDGSAAGTDPEDGEELVVEPPSSDASDDGEDLVDFVVAGAPSSPLNTSSEESAEFTDTDVTDTDAGDAQAELDLAEVDPEGEFVPGGGAPAGVVPTGPDHNTDEDDEDGENSTFASDSDNDADDEGGEDGEDDEDDAATIASDDTLTPIASQSGSQNASVTLSAWTTAATAAATATTSATAVIVPAEAPTLTAAAAANPNPAASTAAEAADAELEENGFIVTGENMQGGPAFSQDSASITTAMKRANPLAPPPVKLVKITVQARVLCKWIHDDRIRLPLLAPWKHGDPSSPTKPGRRLLEARLIRIGDEDTDDQVQFKFLGDRWTWAWNVRLWRMPQPPTCPGCTGNEVVEVTISKPANEVMPGSASL